MRLLSLAAAFLIAMWTIGELWAALRALWSAPSAAAVGTAVAYLALFLAAFTYLGFWVYAADRAAGAVRRRIGLYERILTRRGSRHA
jgi:hypothetical protein